MVNLVAALAASVTLTSSAPAPDGVYALELRRCVVFATSEADRLDFVRWLFTAMSVHPAVSDLSNVTDDMRTEANQKTVALMERLLLADCRAEAVNAIKYEGQTSIEFAFAGVGETAMGDLMSNPLVAAQLSELDALIDNDKWEELAAESGRTTP